MQSRVLADCAVYYDFKSHRTQKQLMSAPAANDSNILRNRIEQLHLEHRDLDDVITRLADSTPLDQLQLQRLKKRKLFVKDQISALERQLTPDIPA